MSACFSRTRSDHDQPYPGATAAQLSPTFRLQVIAETRTPGTSAAEVAHQHDLNTDVVFYWLRDPRYNGKAGTPAFLPVEARPAVLVQEAAAQGRIDVVIELAGGARIRCSDEPSLVAALRAIRKEA